MILLTCMTGEHRAITRVYYIPRSRSHFISLGQLDESGCQVLIQDGVLCVRDREHRLLAKVNQAPNRL